MQFLSKEDYSEYGYILSFGQIILPIVSANTVTYQRHSFLTRGRILRKPFVALIGALFVSCLLSVFFKFWALGFVSSTWLFRLVFNLMSAQKKLRGYFVMNACFIFLQMLVLIYLYFQHGIISFEQRLTAYIGCICVSVIIVLLPFKLYDRTKVSLISSAREAVNFGLALSPSMILGMIILNSDKVILKSVLDYQIYAEYLAGFQIGSFLNALFNYFIIIKLNSLYRGKTIIFPLKLKFITLIMLLFASMILYVILPFVGYGSVTVIVFLVVSVSYIFLYEFNARIIALTSELKYRLINSLFIKRALIYALFLGVCYFLYPSLSVLAFLLSGMYSNYLVKRL
jgi:hypothetical protein